MLGKITILAGDFKPGGQANFTDQFYLPVDGKLSRDTVRPGEIADLEVASEESVKRLGGAIGWGLAGGVALGGIGALAGLIAGGKGADITFVCRFDDGRKFLGRTDSKTFEKMRAAFFDKDKLQHKKLMPQYVKLLLIVAFIVFLVVFLQ